MNNVHMIIGNKTYTFKSKIAAEKFIKNSEMSDDIKEIVLHQVKAGLGTCYSDQLIMRGA